MVANASTRTTEIPNMTKAISLGIFKMNTRNSQVNIKYKIPIKPSFMLVYGLGFKSRYRASLTMGSTMDTHIARARISHIRKPPKRGR